MNQNSLRVIRWVGYIPLAGMVYLATSVVFRPVFHFLNYSALVPYAMEWEGSLFDRLYVEFIPAIISGVILVISGCVIVPNRAGIAAMSLIVLLALMAGFSLAAAFVVEFNGDPAGVVSAACGNLIGASIGVVHVMRIAGLDGKFTLEDAKRWL